MKNNTHKSHSKYNKIGFLPGDIFIAASILLIAAVMFISFALGGRDRADRAACIYIDGELFQQIPFGDETEDIQLEINRDGIEMVIEISDGSVKIRSSNCKNQNCVKTAGINSPNQIIACMPNGVYILIESDVDNTTPEFDAVIG